MRNKIEPRFTYEKKSPLREYIDEKIAMMIDEFYIKLSEAEIDHFYSLKTEEDVDRYAHQLFTERL